MPIVLNILPGTIRKNVLTVKILRTVQHMNPIICEKKSNNKIAPVIIDVHVITCRMLFVVIIIKLLSIFNH